MSVHQPVLSRLLPHRQMRMRAFPIAALLLALSACGGGNRLDRPDTGIAPPAVDQPVRRPNPARPMDPVPGVARPGAVRAADAGLAAGPPVHTLPISNAQAIEGLRAFRLSCPALLRRTDASGLTSAEDWRPACDAAQRATEADARAFFVEQFEAVQVGEGKAFATGYYEPEIAGSRDRRPGYDVPVYGKPGDLLEADLGLFSDELKGKRVRGRVQGNRFVPYFDRTEIENGALDGRVPVIAWAADPVEMFFLQIQGSGRLRLPDGTIMRIGYDNQNGRGYTGIGALMRERGLLQPGRTSMQDIIAWLRANPEQGRAIMRENKSFVFFRELQGAPVGSLNVAVTGRVSAAADPAFVPLGAPVFLSLDRTDVNGLWIVQDTGGAIKGANRFDTFWGAGADARAIAGGMSARGTAFLLLPAGTLARLNRARPDDASPINGPPPLR